MLKGFYREGDIVVDLEGYDLADTFVFYVSCPLVSTRKYLDGGITVEDSNGDTTYYPPVWDELYMSVGTSAVSVSCHTVVDEGKAYKNSINAKFFQRLGSLIRGMKMSCYSSNRIEDINSFGDSFNPSKLSSYSVHGKGVIDVEMGTTIRIIVGDSNSDVELRLVEDHTYGLKVNKLTSKHHKIQLDLSEYVIAVEDYSWSNDFIGESTFSLSEIIDRNPHKSYIWLKERKYHIIRNHEEMEKVCREIWNHQGVVAFDTETTGLNFTFKCELGQGDRLVGMVFSIREGEAWYFPVAHKKIDNICTPENERFIIEKYFKPILEKKEILCHNGSFDWKVMYTYGIFLNIVHDTLILYRLSLWNLNNGLSLKLKDLANTQLGRDSFELSDFVGGNWGDNGVKFWDLPYESVKYYACPDTDNTLGLYNHAVKENLFDKFGMRKIYEVEVGFSMCIAYQEYYGHCADVERSDELYETIKRNMEEAYKGMVDIVGHDFNPNSSKELPKVMFEELGYPVIKRTATGNPSTDKDTLKWFVGKTDENDKPLYPFVHLLKKYKDNRQLESNFIKVLDKLATEDGFMFPSIKQFLETGRASSKNPNYQSYNDTVKKYIIPRRGYYMMDSDYSSVEYRILASMAGQEKLIEDFKDPDVDYHAYQASRMFNVPYELVTKNLRSQAKGINFGLPYGMGDPKLGASIFGARTPENTLKAKKLRKLYFEGQEKIEKFFIDARRNGVANSYSDTHFGRRRYFDKRVKDKSSIEREAGNNRIQGTAADIYKIAMVRLLTRIRKNGWLGKVLISAFVHDECLLEVHKSIDPAVMLKTIRECLMLNIPGWCPLYIGAGYGTSWYSAKKTEIPVQVQDIIINNWGEEGLDWWDGDTEKLYDWEVGLINDYKRDRVISYLRNEDNWGKVLKPVENAFAHEVLEEVLSDRHVDGVVNRDVHTDKDTVLNLEQFCKCFGVTDLFEKANIQRPVYTENKDNDLEDTNDNVEEEAELDFSEVLKMKIESLGVCIDKDSSKIYIRFDDKDPVLMKSIHRVIVNNSGNYLVMAVKNDGSIYKTELSMGLKGYTDLIATYMSRRNRG